MSAAHHPGPWKLVMDENYARITCDLDGGDNLRGYCGLANARLIVSAPELLDALQKLVAFHDAEHNEFSDAIDNARAAIAKAEGGAL